MAQPFSSETLELFDRAQRAIDTSVRLRQERRDAIRKAQKYQLEFELRMSQERWRSIS
jgi:hypothetical protein